MLAVEFGVTCEYNLDSLCLRYIRALANGMSEASSMKESANHSYPSAKAKMGMSSTKSNEYLLEGEELGIPCWGRMGPTARAQILVLHLQS